MTILLCQADNQLIEDPVFETLCLLENDAALAQRMFLELHRYWKEGSYKAYCDLYSKYPTRPPVVKAKSIGQRMLAGGITPDNFFTWFREQFSDE